MKLTQRTFWLFAWLYPAFISVVLGRPPPMVDLTYEYSSRTPSYSRHKKFEITERKTFKVSDTVTFIVNEFASSEHAGTHMDAPVHFLQDKITIDQLPIDHFEGPAVVINITEKAAKDSDALITMDDVKAWEEENGEILNGSIVLMNSGWGRHARNQTAYLGGNGTKNLHFPGFSPDVCQWLIVNRGVVGVGADTVSPDRGSSFDYGCHRVVAEVNAFILENLANVDKLPPKGAIVRAYPLKIADGTGSPARVIAALPKPTAY